MTNPIVISCYTKKQAATGSFFLLKTRTQLWQRMFSSNWQCYLPRRTRQSRWEHLVRARKAQWLALRSQRYPYSTKGEPRSQSFPTTLKHWNIYLTHFASSELHGWPRPPAPAVFALRGLHLNLGSLSACPGVLGRGIFGSFLRI